MLSELPPITLTSLAPKSARKLHKKDPSLPSIPSDALRSSKTTTTWGRSASNRPWLRSLFTATPLWAGPLAAVTFEIALRHFDGSLVMVISAYRDQGILPVLYTYGPRWNLNALVAYTCWIALQAVLYVGLPGPIQQGQQTPAGHLLSYRVNGLQAWFLTYSMLGALSVFGVVDLAAMAEDWSGWFVAMNLLGFLASAVAFVKGHVAPTHPNDRKITGKTLLPARTGLGEAPKICDANR